MLGNINSISIYSVEGGAKIGARGRECYESGDFCAYSYFVLVSLP